MIAVRHPLLWGAAQLLACSVLVAVTALTAAGQDVDWRSSLILHFEPPASGAAANDSYIARVADELASGWSADAVVVGPFSELPKDFGAASEWARLAQSIDQSGAVLAVRVDPGSDGDVAELVEWSRAAGVRHFIVEDGDAEASGMLRTALDMPTASAASTGASASSWIAASSASQPARFDAVVESLSADQFADDASLDNLYVDRAARAASSPWPVIASIHLSKVADRDPARVLMTPGALLLTIGDKAADPDLWRQIAAFRARHPSIATGEHVRLVNNMFAFARTSADAKVNDTVIVVLGASGNTTINVSRVFPDNAMLQDALTGRTAFVSFGMASFEAGPTGILLIEEAF